MVKPVSTAAENARSGPRVKASDAASNRDEVFVSGTLIDSEVFPPMTSALPSGRLTAT